jgi:hypothetical protein
MGGFFFAALWDISVRFWYFTSVMGVDYGFQLIYPSFLESSLFFVKGEQASRSLPYTGDDVMTYLVTQTLTNCT